MSKSKEARGILILLSLVAWSCVAANYRTPNFNVTAPTAEFAKQVGDSAEVFRRQLSKEWLGKEFERNWAAPCPITVKVGQIGAGGATSFSFDRDSKGEMHVFGWNMSIQGSEERILDSVLPHEITHMILACHFRCPLPRWADEGAATLAEHESEKRQQVLRTRQLMGSSQRIPLSKLVTIMQYPNDMREVLNLYAEGYSLVELLVQKGGKTGKARYLSFLAEALRNGWDKATKKYYNYRNLDELEMDWHKWVAAGSPTLGLPEGQELARNDGRPRAGRMAPTIRGQTPDEPSPAGRAIAQNDPTTRNRLSAPSPRRGVRIQRPENSPAPKHSPAVSLGDSEELGQPQNDPLPETDVPAPRSRAAKPRASLPKDEANNPGWSPINEDAEAPSIGETPAPNAFAATDGQPSTNRDSDNRSVERSTDGERRDLSGSEDDVEVGRNTAEQPPKFERKPQRLAPAYPRRKATSPRWSEFPQVSRPSPFTDLPTVSRQ